MTEAFVLAWTTSTSNLLEDDGEVCDCIALDIFGDREGHAMTDCVLM